MGDKSPKNKENRKKKKEKQKQVSNPVIPTKSDSKK